MLTSMVHFGAALRRTLPRAGLLALVLAAGVAFAQDQPAGDAAPAAGRARGGAGRAPRATGIVQAISETSITLAGPRGGASVSAQLGSETKVMKLEKASPDDIAGAKWITVMIGTTAADPTAKVARSVTLLDEKPADAPAPATARRNALRSVSGQGSVASGVLTIKTADATETATLGPRAIVSKGVPAKLSDVKSGDNVRVTYENKDGQWQVRTIGVLPQRDPTLGTGGGNRRGGGAGAAGGAAAPAEANN